MIPPDDVLSIDADRLAGEIAHKLAFKALVAAKAHEDEATHRAELSAAFRERSLVRDFQAEIIAQEDTNIAAHYANKAAQRFNRMTA